MKEEYLKIGEIPAVLYGDKSDRLYLFVHGKQGHKEEAADFAAIACPKGWQVLAIDLPAHGGRKDKAAFDPWHVVPELRAVMEYVRLRWAHIALRATSIGAWFSMVAFAEVPLEKVLFVSPVLDMEKLICNMMLWANVSEERLQTEQEIVIDFGETLSWRYLQYAKEHPVVTWRGNTAILYAGNDNLTDRTTVDEFVHRFDCELTVMEDGEHWFHTPEQLEVLTRWTSSVVMDDNDKRTLLSNLHQLHTTDLGVVRIKRNLSLLTDDVVGWCKEQIQRPDASILRRGKNWYIHVADCEITVNAYSQLLSAIYDMETFGNPERQEEKSIAVQRSTGLNDGAGVTLTFAEPPPAMKELTAAVEEPWLELIQAAIKTAQQEKPLPHFEKAFVWIEVVSSRDTNHARVWDTSNRAINVIINNLKWIFFLDDDMEHMAFGVAGSWGEKVLRLFVFQTSPDCGKSDHQIFNAWTAKPWAFKIVIEKHMACWK